MPTDCWVLNDMLHDLVAQPAQVYVVWRIDFVPRQLSAAAASITPVHTKWLDVAGNPSIYPVFDALRSGRPQRHLHVPRPGARLGPPSVRRRGR